MDKTTHCVDCSLQILSGSKGEEDEQKRRAKNMNISGMILGCVPQIIYNQRRLFVSGIHNGHFRFLDFSIQSITESFSCWAQIKTHKTLRLMIRIQENKAKSGGAPAGILRSRRHGKELYGLGIKIKLNGNYCVCVIAEKM